ncbi:MAG TPA: CaiB/BaiF CoA-transferase family protein [Gammaproteobacteria bacterium]|nr:CaiB/BaiF CoA-transferase family protein [Gammaproteobacteria bacterium]
MGPLRGIRIVEFAGIGPGPLCGTFLGDLGADVVRVDRAGSKSRAAPGAGSRSRRSLALNLKDPRGIEVALRLIESADGMFEPYRPGVMERLGLGPQVCLERNPRLVYGRMTGWGQDGPLANAAGHDINYIALTGALNAIGESGGGPIPPLNLIGDFGGGTMLLAFGMVCGLLEAARSGQGQVVDTAMVDGASMLMAMIYGMKDLGLWTNTRGDNLLDGGAHFYGCYECSDGKWISIGSIEPQFYALLRETLGLDDKAFDAQHDKTAWPALKAEFKAAFATKTREEWVALMEGTDICFAPVLDLDEAPQHPHNVARNAFIEVDGVLQPAPAPRFSRTPAAVPRAAPKIGGDSDAVLNEAGFLPDEINDLRQSGVIA